MTKFFLFLLVFLTSCSRVPLISPPLYPPGFNEIYPGIYYMHKKIDKPLNINAIFIDLKNPAVKFRVAVGKDRCRGTETVAKMAERYGAQIAVNGDYWTNYGIPLSMTVIDYEMYIAPKYRTTLGISEDNSVKIGMWTDRWNWYATCQAPSGETHDIVMMNSDCSTNWLCLYSDKYGAKSKGRSVSPVVELVINSSMEVTDIRENMPGVDIPDEGYVLTGRGNAGIWLKDNFNKGDSIVLDFLTKPPWYDLKYAIGAGPRIILDGKFYQDPYESIPEGEEFTKKWKHNHYDKLQPRTAVGITEDERYMILVVVDGRQAKFSIGVSQRELADMLLEFGAFQAMEFDSGGSSTMVIDGKAVNHVSDRAKPDGSGGVERSVCNALLVFSEEAD
jgi:phosphodiester glycosidase